MSKNSGKHTQSLKIPTIVLVTVKLIAFISTKWMVRFAAKLFTTPIKHKTPKRELEMDQNSKQQKLFIPAIQKEIVVYEIGSGSKKILLVHGWSGRGTQLVKFAEELVKQDYTVISFDAPAHGKSEGKASLMPEFIESILEIERQYGSFDAAIGHSLGGMSLLNAVRKGFKINKLITIGSGDIVQDIIDDFIKNLKLTPKIGILMRLYFEDKYKSSMDSLSAYHSAKQIDIPVLVIHDENDPEVGIKAAYHIKENLKNGKLIITQNLGHRKILGDKHVIQETMHFLLNKTIENGASLQEVDNNIR